VLDFPNTPQIDDLFPDPALPGVPQWRWDGQKWINHGISGADAPIDGRLYGRLNGAWAEALPITGGTVTGNFDVLTNAWVGSQANPTDSFFNLYTTRPDALGIVNYAGQPARIAYIVNGLANWVAGINADGTWGLLHHQSLNSWIYRQDGVFQSLFVIVGDYIIVGTQGYKPGGGLWADSSDARIKEVRGNYTGGLEEIEQLQPVTYRYRGNDLIGETDGDSHHKQAAQARTEFVGLVAQDVEKVMPELVKRVPGYVNHKQVHDLRALDATPLIYALVNAVKELSERLKAVETAKAGRKR